MIKRLKSKKGFTLVELIVTFALIGIIMIITTGVIASSIRVEYRVENLSNAQVVSRTILDTVISELAPATKRPLESGSDIAIRSQNGMTEFTDKNGIPVVLSVTDEGLLNLKYNTGDENVDWSYGKKSYMNNRIESLSFEKERENRVSVTLKLKNEKTGFEYTTKKIITFYNLEAINMDFR
ncbi:prepilin-type N-terminal cleavage/methylation domain-containing protein [Aequitasia blattaphilus]|uniref:Prepilin-type N-terminal cleavage/methylation domain-containing protein n=1 Tax=Aequitasia blattaphilus TaxID=2949332 RepID=A0ABT1E7W2_9FIRM|nr:prepilin-type N-terminal cleavage/methylation domain-containing protein [Aequitasia blattaphilus]MCP1101911.1 prepilin-type N-terminal cleavage/methylation domain-containing protein [Aequitasia blattaphilus]MCR8614551.1 prepilin-type N-terminal cleavage/methylation domain-containing protein [Aequitasia blattaphilus]